MKECPAIVAALPREVRHLVRGWQRHLLPGKVVAYTSESGVVACAGMGAVRATLAVQAALSLRPVTVVVSVGLAGACDPALRVGDVVRVGVVVDAQTGERFGDAQSARVLVSAGAIASVAEKRRLYESYGASAVDMEAAAVARIAEANGLRFEAIKAISDDAGFELRELAWFATHDGQFREAAFAMHAGLRPQLWGKLLQLAGNSNRALRALTAEVESRLDWYRQRV
jgi:adenosylhomocysteine nucleosidase